MKMLTPDEMKKAINLLDDEWKLANARFQRDRSSNENSVDYDGEALVAHAKRTADVRVRHIMNAAKALTQP